MEIIGITSLLGAILVIAVLFTFGTIWAMENFSEDCLVPILVIGFIGLVTAYAMYIPEPDNTVVHEEIVGAIQSMTLVTNETFLTPARIAVRTDEKTYIVGEAFSHGSEVYVLKHTKDDRQYLCNGAAIPGKKDCYRVWR